MRWLATTSRRRRRRQSADSSTLPLLPQFDRLRGTSRIFDSGDIVIYDVRQLVARARAGSELIATLAVATACSGRSRIAVDRRIASAVLLVLVLPGLALTSVLFPARALRCLGRSSCFRSSLSICRRGHWRARIACRSFGLTTGSWAVLFAGGDGRCGDHRGGENAAHARCRRTRHRAVRAAPRPRRDPALAVRGRWLVNGALFGLALG